MIEIFVSLMISNIDYLCQHGQIIIILSKKIFLTKILFTLTKNIKMIYCLSTRDCCLPVKASTLFGSISKALS